MVCAWQGVKKNFHWIRLWPNQKTFFRINICTCFVKNQAVADVDAKTVCKVYSKTKRNIEHLILWRWVLCCANKSVHRLCVHLKISFNFHFITTVIFFFHHSFPVIVIVQFIFIVRILNTWKMSLPSSLVRSDAPALDKRPSWNKEYVHFRPSS